MPFTLGNHFLCTARAFAIHACIAACVERMKNTCSARTRSCLSKSGGSKYDPVSIYMLLAHKLCVRLITYELAHKWRIKVSRDVRAEHSRRLAFICG